MNAAKQRWWGPLCIHRKDSILCKSEAEHDSNFCARHRAELLELLKKERPTSTPWWAWVLWPSTIGALLVAVVLVTSGCAQQGPPPDECFIWVITTDGNRTCIERRDTIKEMYR